MDCPEHLKDMDLRSMTVMERILFYSYEAHSDFERAMEHMHPVIIEQAEQGLYEMLGIIKTVREKMEDQEQLAVLDQIEKVLELDYQHYQGE
ncbi:MAG TPA: hypothetical protein VN426_12885 [Syntrophomonadaceae bacterium]|nr:hypothetical protein [Syntrophomonadaceae bacterium]